MNLGRTLILAGLALVVVGVLVSFAGKLPFRLGRLPGDIYIGNERGGFYFPVVTCLLVSAVLTLLGWLFRR